MRTEPLAPAVSQCVHDSPSDAVAADISMSDASEGKSARRRIAAAAGIVVAAALASGAAFHLLDDHAAATRARPAIRSGTLRYEFDTLTGREWLFDTADGDEELRCVLRERPADAARLRAALERDLGVTSLDELCAEQSGTVRELRRLGYL